MELIWYLADLVTEVRVEGTEKSVVHFDLHLVRARNAMEAYDKALRIGNGKTKQYLRNDGNLMSFIFRGLNDLVAMDEEFADGARILFRSQPEMNEEEIQHVVTPRDYLRAVQAEGFDEGTSTIQ
eukprot:TRINITY_DN55779_c0_g1_i2.p2 TRINITY_DN55779_c0_g1~~TRINITY_DN55779_c0_g1_i2.p2  ORF type:complete len:125 (-),score=34.71 TRINITY_DN55779_c0_g1_i2:50-424(-)